MRIPLFARIGIYLILSGLALDLILHFSDHFEYLLQAKDVSSTLLLPLGLILLVVTGVFQFIAIRRPRIERVSLTSLSPQAGELHLDSETISPYDFQWAQKLPLEPAFSGLPSFGLICALVLSWLVMLHMVFYQWGRFRDKGLVVSVMNHVPSAASSEPLVISIRVAGQGQPPKVYLNSRRLSWEELDGSLKAELSKRSVWAVYVEADSNVSWQDALRAIDAARGLQARVVLLTSRTKAKQN